MELDYAIFYRSMNVNHLLDDELEYELALRKVDFSSGESRDIKRRKLRGAMKEERDSNSFVSRKIVEEARESEARQVEEKVAMIRDSLENRTAKKAELPQLKTRLVHLYFRLLRLKKVFNTAGLEQITLRLLKEYFSQGDRDADVLAGPSRRNVPIRLGTHESKEQESEEDLEDSSSPRTEGDNLQSSEENEELEFSMRNTRSRRSSTPKAQENKVVSADELFERIMQQVDKVITTKLKNLNIGATTEQPRVVQKLGVSKKDKPLGLERKIKPRPNSKQRDAKLKFRKSGRANSESSENSTGREDDSEKGDTDTERENVGRGQKFHRRPRPVCDWKLKYDGRDDGRGLNKFVAEVEFMAEAENISKRNLRYVF